MKTPKFKLAGEEIFSKMMIYTKVVTEILFLLIFTIFLSGCDKDVLIKNVDNETEEIAPSLKSAGDFTIVVMPDIQNYMSGYFGGTEAMFTSQINWIINNKTTQNIAYVIGLGDIVEHGDEAPAEWVKAKNGYYQLESAGIPYGLAVGNHDGTPFNGHVSVSPVWSTNQYNTYFGVSHFTGKSYYGGHYGSNNNSHYDLFSAGGVDFIAIYVEYDHYNENATNINTWAYNLLSTYSSRKAIIVTHYLIGVGDPASFGAQAYDLWNQIKVQPNVFMMLGGHVYGEDYVGEGYKETTWNGVTIRSYLSDYQQRSGGGNGYMRLMRFSVINDDVTVKTYSPYLNTYETDINSQFTKPLFSPAPTAQIPDGKYKIIARNSGKALVVLNASSTAGENIVQWDYTPELETNDEWYVTYQNNGYYRFTNLTSGMDMNVAGTSTAVGAEIVQWLYNSTTPRSFEWGLMPIGSGYYKITARNSGLCLNVAGGGSNNGALIKQWTYDGSLNEQFQLVPCTQISDGRYKIIARNSGKALVVSNASTTAGANIVQWGYSSASPTNDEWDVTHQGNGYYRFTNANSSMDMNVEGTSMAVGAEIVQWTYSSSTPKSFEWELIPVGSGYYKIISRNSGLCLNVAGGGSNDGALIKQWTYDGTSNEQFQMVVIP